MGGSTVLFFQLLTDASFISKADSVTQIKIVLDW